MERINVITENDSESTLNSDVEHSFATFSAQNDESSELEYPVFAENEYGEYTERQINSDGKNNIENHFSFMLKENEDSVVSSVFAGNAETSLYLGTINENVDEADTLRVAVNDEYLEFENRENNQSEYSRADGTHAETENSTLERRRNLECVGIENQLLTPPVVNEFSSSPEIVNALSLSSEAVSEHLTSSGIVNEELPISSEIENIADVETVNVEINLEAIKIVETDNAESSIAETEEQSPSFDTNIVNQDNPVGLTREDTHSETGTQNSDIAQDFAHDNHALSVNFLQLNAEGSRLVAAASKDDEAECSFINRMTNSEILDIAEKLRLDYFVVKITRKDKESNLLLRHAILKDLFTNILQHPEDIIEAKPIRSSDSWLFMIKSAKCTKQICSLTHILDCEVEIILLKDRISKKFIMRRVDESLTMNDINEELINEYNIYSLYLRRFTKKENGKLKKTKSVMLQLIGSSFPQRLKFYGMIHDLVPFVEKPSICQNCAKYGHRAKFCKNDPMCLKCAGNHKMTNCNSDEEKCMYCGQKHSADFKGCVRYAEEEEILKIKSTYGISYFEAKMKFLNYQRVCSTAEVEICSICLEQYLEHDDIRQTPCGHLFHPTCLQQWLNTERTCPVCRQFA